MVTLAIFARSRPILGAARIIAAAWLLNNLFYYLAPYHHVWGYLITDIAQLTYFYVQFKKPDQAKPTLFKALLLMHTGMLIVSSSGYFIWDTYLLKSIANRIFELEVLTMYFFAGMAIALNRLPGFEDHLNRQLDRLDRRRKAIWRHRH